MKNNYQKFTISTQIVLTTNAMGNVTWGSIFNASARNSFGYPSNKVKSIGIKLVDVALSTTAPIVPTQFKAGFNTSGFTLIGYNNVPGGLTLANLQYNLGNTLAMATSGPEFFLRVADSDTYLTENFYIALYDWAGVQISTADIIVYTLQLTEFVSTD